MQTYYSKRYLTLLKSEETCLRVKKMFKLALEVIAIGTLLNKERSGLGFASKQYSRIMA